MVRICQPRRSWSAPKWTVAILTLMRNQSPPTRRHGISISGGPSKPPDGLSRDEIARSRGTEGSNLLRSSAESATNLVAAGGVARGWDSEFESALLQQRVRSEPGRRRSVVLMREHGDVDYPRGGKASGANPVLPAQGACLRANEGGCATTRPHRYGRIFVGWLANAASHPAAPGPFSTLFYLPNRSASRAPAPRRRFWRRSASVIPSIAPARRSASQR